MFIKKLIHFNSKWGKPIVCGSYYGCVWICGRKSRWNL